MEAKNKTIKEEFEKKFCEVEIFIIFFGCYLRFYIPYFFCSFCVSYGDHRSIHLMMYLTRLMTTKKIQNRLIHCYHRYCGVSLNASSCC